MQRKQTWECLNGALGYAARNWPVLPVRPNSKTPLLSDWPRQATTDQATSARIVDGRGKYLIPGQWDMHVHRTEYESTYPIYLANGVTGVREMPTNSGPSWRKQYTDTPHLYLASPIVDGYPPRWPDQIAVRNAEEAQVRATR